METHVPHLSKVVLPIAFALVSVIAMVLGFRVFGGSLPLEAKGYRVGVPLRDSSNLAPGSDVQVAGVDIGNVVSIRPDGRGSLATIQVDRRFAPLRVDARALPRTKSLLGEAYLQLQAAVRAGNAVLTTTGTRRRELAATVRALAPFLRQLRTTADTMSSASGDIERAVAALLPVAPKVRPVLTEINAAAPEFRRLMRGLPRTLSAADAGLPALTRMLPAVRRGLRRFYPLSRELIPVMELLAVNKQTPPSVMANLASITNGSYVGGDGTVFHYGRAVATVWNELIAGWKRKLPTSRPFPYPKPGALNDIARNGFLRSYDCRHTKNPLYLPPIGRATPCVEQGPWTFDGRSAYYPRLLLDRP